MRKSHKTFLSRSSMILMILVSNLLMAQLQPQVTGSHSKELLVSNQNWSRVWNLTSEWDSFNADHWSKTPVEAPWTWEGRFPGLFEEDNVVVWNGELRIEAEKFASPKRSAQWTHGGGLVRSRAKMKKGMYVECSMKTTETIMSGTFWLITTPGSACPRVEIDITESVGVASNTSTWDGFLNGMNTNTHARGSCVTNANIPMRSANFNPDAAFNTYGMYWESETQLHFYRNGRFMWTITPPANASQDMHIMMVVETYNFNNPSTGSNAAEIDGFNKPKWRRQTRYKWVRTWEVNNNSNIARGLEGVLDNNEINQDNIVLNVSPSLVENVLTIEGLSNVANVVVFDLLGQKVLSTSTTEKVDVSSLKKGVYLLSVEGEKQPIRFIKK